MLANLQSRKQTLFNLVLVAVLGFAAYSNTLSVPFIFDDLGIISNNPRIRDVSNIPSMFVELEGLGASRPLMHASNALNYHFGGMDTRGYHAVNIALHIVNGALLYFLLIMTGRRLAFREEVVRSVAVAASLLFVLHPAQTEAVTNTVNRSMLFAATFYFAGMMLFLKSVTAERGKGLYVAALFVVSLMGMASRENFVTFPFVLILYDYFILSGFRLRQVWGHYREHLPAFLSLGYFIFLVLNNTYTSNVADVEKGISPVNYVLTEFGVHWTYLRLLLLPVGQSLDYDYPIAQGLFEFPTIMYFAGYIGLWAAGLAVARKWPVVSFGILWFLICAIPICFAVAVLDLRLDDVIFEHRLYLPSAGPIVLAALGAVYLSGKISVRKFRVAATIALALIPLTLAVGAYARNAVWSSEISLWEDVVNKAPEKWRGHYNLGNIYKAAGFGDMALEQYGVSLKFKPDHSMSYNNVGNIYLGRGLYDKAIDNFQQAVGLKPEYEDAHYNMGIAYYLKGQYAEAVEHYRAAIRLDPNDADTRNNLGAAYLKLGEIDSARKEFEAALKLDPGLHQARKLLLEMSVSD